MTLRQRRPTQPPEDSGEDPGRLLSTRALLIIVLAVTAGILAVHWPAWAIGFTVFATLAALLHHIVGR